MKNNEQEKKYRPSFTVLQREMPPKHFNCLALEIATEYVKEKKTQKNIAQENEISEDAVADFLEYAIVNYIVDDTMAKAICERSVKNQSRYAPTGNISTKLHYERLMKKRDEYVILLFSDEKIKRLAEYFANNPDKSLQEIAKSYGLNEKVVETLLKKAIKEHICDDKTFMMIEERSMKVDSSPEAKQFFANLREKREAGRKNFFG